MRRQLLIAATLASAVTLSACNTTNFGQNVKTLVDSGCKGTLHVDASAGTATGLSPGAGSGRVNFDGSCDPADRVGQAPPAP